MGDPTDHAASIFREMRETAEQILELSISLELTCAEEAAEKEITDYAKMVDKREPLIKKLSILRKEADSCPIESRKGCVLQDAEKVDRLLVNIVQVNKEHTDKLSRIKEALNATLKGIKEGRKLNNAYAGAQEEAATGLLDAKQ